MDHYPHFDAERAALIADIVAQLGLPPVAPGAPGAPAPSGRFVKFGDAMICTTCKLDARYCRGHTPPPAPAKDGAESDLARRIKDCQGGR